MRLMIMVGLSLLSFCLWQTPGSAVTLASQGTSYILENSYVRVGIDTAKGATVTDYFIKATKMQLVGDGCSMLIDHFWQQNWPGEFLNAPYEARIVTQGADAATLEVSRLSQGWLGNTQQSGLKVIRRITLRDDSPLLHVEVTVENTGKAGRVMGYWSQNILYANGDKQEKHLYFRPSIRGVSVASYESKPDRAIVDFEPQDGFVRDPQQAWMVSLGADSHRGMAFVMSYDELMFLYNCFSFFTNEWQYKATGIPGGKSWKTAFDLYPIAGFARVDYASRALVASVEPQDAAGKITVQVHLAAAGMTLQGLTIKGDYISARKPTAPAIVFATQSAARIGATPARFSFTAPHALADPIIIRFSVRAACGQREITEQFQVYYGGSYGKNWQTDGSPLYILPSPERHIMFMKPEQIVKTHNAVPRVLFCKGLFADTYLPATLFSAMGAQVTPSNFSFTHAFP
ncbi:MAG TPA: hypothetical protein VGL77_15755, partial [Armatimonadota bacterium]